MKILIITTRDKRERYRFLSEPLAKIENVKITLFRNDENILNFIVKSLFYAVRNRDFNLILVYGGDFKSLFWTFLARTVVKAKVICRLGGDPIVIRKKVIKTVLANHKFFRYVKLAINYFITKILLRCIDGAVVVNKSLIVSLKKYTREGIPIAVIPQPIAVKERAENSFFTAKREEFHLLTVTNLSYRDKYEGVCMVIKNLSEEFKSNYGSARIVYDILGGGYYLEKLKKFLEKYTDLPDNLKINMHGYVERTEPFYKNADLFIYSSTVDATPNVLLEAQSYGLALLVNSYEPFYNILKEDVNALFFDDRAGVIFRSKFNELLENKALRERMGRNNLENIEKNYSIGAIAQKWESFLSKQEIRK